MFLPYVPFFVLLIVIVAVALAVVAWRRRDTPVVEDPGIGTVRRLYFYTVSFVSLMMAANGVALLIEYVLEAAADNVIVVSPSQERLAAGLPLVIVGLALWLLHWRWVQRSVRELPVERRSVIRKFYMYLALGVAVAFLVGSSIEIIQWGLRTEEFNGFPWGAVVAFGAVWAYHWRLESVEGQATIETRGLRRLYLYLVSLVTLAMLAVGAGRVVHIVLLEGYDALVSTPVVVPAQGGLWRPALRDMLALAIAGGAAWAVHWFYFARRDFRSVLRQVYLYVFAILGGVVTVLVALGFLINGVVGWLLNVAPDETASEFFRFLPGVAASLAVGAILWAYHWTVVRREADFSVIESVGSRRAYAYILAALGLAALVVAIGTGVNTALGVLIESGSAVVRDRDLWREPLSIAITLVLIGLPLWGYYWRSIQQQVAAGGAGEREALPRRIFIFAVLAAGVLAFIGGVSTLIFFVLRDFLDAGLARDTARDVQTVLSILAPVLVFLPYYWMVYRNDSRAASEAPAPAQPAVRRKDVTVFVRSGGETIVGSLEAALGYRINTLDWADPDASQPYLTVEEWQALARQIGGAEGGRVLVVPNGTIMRVLSYN